MQRVQVGIGDMPIVPVDAHSPIPLYFQIYLQLKALIKDGTIPPGAVLPPEIEISRSYGVGRQTIRRTIARLVDEDLVERYPGRGTFVKSRSERLKFLLDRSFTQQAKAMGYTPRSKVLCMESGAIDSSYPEELHPYMGRPCLNLERLRYGGDDPVCYQATTVLSERCPALERHDFGVESLFEVLATQYGLWIQRMDYVVRAVAADDYRAELLGVKPGSPLLYVATAIYLDDGALIEYTVGYYRADRYQYSTSHVATER